MKHLLQYRSIHPKKSLPFRSGHLLHHNKRSARLPETRLLEGFWLCIIAAFLIIFLPDLAEAQTYTFTSTSAVVNEYAGTVTIGVTRTDYDYSSEVQWETVDGTAKGGQDYTSQSGVLSWGEYDSNTKYITIPILNDAIAEGNETFQVQLSCVEYKQSTRMVLPPYQTICQVGSPITITIADDDVVCFQFTSAEYTISEGAGSQTMTVTKTGASAGTVSVNYSADNGTAIGGSDYTPVSGTLSWGPNDTAPKTFSVPILQDSVNESSETFKLRLTCPQYVQGDSVCSLCTPSQATITILDDDRLGFQFSQAEYSVSEGGGMQTITVVKTGSSVNAVSVNYGTSNGTATAGSDYAGTSGKLTWEPNDSSSKTFTVQILQDSVAEGDERLNLTLSSPSPADSTLGPDATLTIKDDDAVTIQFSETEYTTNENGGTKTITVTKTGSNAVTVSVNYTTSNGTATSGSDYASASGTLTWPAGDSTPKTFAVQILQDALVEGDETVNLALGNPSPSGVAGLGNPDSAALIIRDDDYPPAPAGSTIEKVSGEELTGPPGSTLSPFVIRVRGPDKSPLANIQVKWSSEPSSSAAVESPETVTNAEGLAYNSISVKQAGTLKLVAKADGAGSTAFTVNGLADTKGLTENELSVARALDNACPALAKKAETGILTPAEADLLATCNKLYGTSSDNLGDKLRVLSPEYVAAQGRAAIEGAAIQVTNLHRRLTALRGGATGISLSGLNLNIPGQTAPNNLLASMDRGSASDVSSTLPTNLFASMTKASGSDASGKETSFRPLDGRLGVFINGQVSFGDRDSTTNEIGYDFDTKGITGGVDYRFTDQLIFGLAIGYGKADTDYDLSSGSLDVDTGSISLYGTYYLSQKIYIDGIFTFARNDFDSKRLMDSESRQFGLGDTSSTGYAIDVGGGYEFNRGGFTFGPYVRLDYTRVDIDGYDESASNAGVAGFGSVLSIDSQKVDSLQTVLGGRASYSINTGIGVFVPQLRFEWVHEFENDSRDVVAQFIYDPTNTKFVTVTDDPDRDFFNLGAGLSATFPRGISAFLYYETLLGMDYTALHTFTGGIRIEF